MKQFCFLLLSLAVAVTGNLREQKLVAPRFEDYPAIVGTGRWYLSIPRSHSLARMYRTSMRQQVADEGVNFAGPLFTGLDGLRYRLFDYGHH